MMGPKMWGLLLGFRCKLASVVLVASQTRLHETFRDNFSLALLSVYLIDMARLMLHPCVKKQICALHVVQFLLCTMLGAPSLCML